MLTDPSPLTATTGVILAGGASSRFGSNKALALLHDKRIIQHVADIMEAIFPDHLLVTNTPETYSFLGWKMVGDIFESGGPLAGIHTALRNITGNQAFITACDMPLINQDLITFLCNCPGKWDAAIPWLDMGPEPLYGVYRKSALSVIENELHHKQRKIRLALEKLRLHKMSQDEALSIAGDLTTFHNINRLQDLELLQPNLADDTLSLDKARKLIIDHVFPKNTETISLQGSLGRRPARSLTANIPVPHFTQSTMDGFAVSSLDLQGSTGPWHLPVSHEIAAGRTDIPKLRPHTAIRIMTGGTVPLGANQVIPQEWCRESGDQITIMKCAKPGKHIRKVGTDLKKGQLIVGKGQQIRPFHLHLLSTSATETVEVFRKPTVAFLCTGSELVDATPLPGQVISGNRPLLTGLIEQSGGIAQDLGMAQDISRHIQDKLEAPDAPEIIITTGGMGPGKFDLVGEVLSQMGVRILYHSLQVRPGQSTLFGIQGNTLFFSLPGPPPAVQTLFNELIRPAIMAFLGRKNVPFKTRAILQEDIVIRKKGILNLKSAITSLDAGVVKVRPVGLTEAADSTILVPASRKQLRAGEKVSIHMHINN